MSYKITYWPDIGRAEQLRIALELAGQKYEQVFFKDEEWPQVKQKLISEGKLAFGQVPLLEHEGKCYVQSKAALRHLGRKYNLYGNNNEESYLIDMMIDGCEDFENSWFAVFDLPKKDPKKVEYETQVAPKHLTLLDNLMKGKKYVLGDKPSIGDAALYGALTNMTYYGSEDVVIPFKHLMDFLNNLSEYPAIKAYLASGRQPKTKE